MASMRRVLCLSGFAALSLAAPTKETVGKRAALPDYAITYAPWSYLQSGESWFPSDIVTHLQNTSPDLNYVAQGAVGSATTDNLNSYSGNVYLTAPDDSSSVAWLESNYGKPSSSGYSAAPGTIIAVEKNSTWTDVFYFYFYSYNYGGKVLSLLNFDDHVGDWEHSMIRFYNGQPYAIYLSEHGAGSAYYWDVMTKQGVKPITYIAHGGHANYATAGTIDYTIALGLITDKTDAGFPWDMAQNYRGYWYDTASGTFSAASGTTTSANWLSWQGQWGNQYNSSSPGQFCLFGECHLANGPTGPVAKNLGRTAMCENESNCQIFSNLNDVTIQAKRRRRMMMMG